MEFQKKAPLHLNEFLPTSRLNGGEPQTMAQIITAIATTKKPNYVIW